MTAAQLSDQVFPFHRSSSGVLAPDEASDSPAAQQSPDLGQEMPSRVAKIDPLMDGMVCNVHLLPFQPSPSVGLAPDAL